jgi:CRP-like cAMP-binding protein
MGPGQFFGEIGLLHSRHAIASVRAAGDSPVQLAVLDKDVFKELLDTSVSTRKAFVEIAQTRLSENRSKLKNK